MTKKLAIAFLLVSINIAISAGTAYLLSGPTSSGDWVPLINNNQPLDMPSIDDPSMETIGA